MEDRAEAWITPNPTVVDGSETLAAALEKMAVRNIGAVLIQEEGRLAGIFTERDLLRLLPHRRGQDLDLVMDTPIRSFMTENPIRAGASDDYNTVYMKMKVHNIRHIPVVDGERLVGIISMRDLVRFYQNRLESEFNDTRMELENLKKLVGASERHRFETLVTELRMYRELSLTDYLTGLFNKRYFQARIVEEVTRARRYNEQLSLIFCDIDYFKEVNDRYGHPWGDEILREMARLLSGTVDELHVVSRLRKSDIVARYGGEEFVIILPETAREGAGVAAEKLRRVVQDHLFHADGAHVRLTMSFGAAALAPEDPDHNAIIRNADYAMYVAKNSGRNRVIVHPVDSPKAASSSA